MSCQWQKRKRIVHEEKILTDKNISHFLPYTGGLESFIFKYL